MNIEESANSYFAFQNELFEHVGYTEQWRVFPIVDSRVQYWAVGRGERSWFRHSPNLSALTHWLMHDSYDDLAELEKNVLYQSHIYTQRHLDKWVFRGEKYAMAIVDTQVDLNVWMEILEIDREIKLLPEWEMYQ